MLTIGLTGGFATGKSVVANMFAKLGARLIDCDKIAREIVEPGSIGLLRVVTEFGEDVLTKDGSLNRKKLAGIIFSDTQKREKLEASLHPLILRRVIFMSTEIEEESPDTVIVVEAPLLFESGLYKNTDFTVTVTCSNEEQIIRGMKRDSLTKDEVAHRISAQWSMEKKIKLSDYAIDNKGSLDETYAEVEQIWHDRVKT